VVLKEGGIAPLGDDFDLQWGEKNKAGDRGRNNTKGAKMLKTTNRSLH